MTAKKRDKKKLKLSKLTVRKLDTIEPKDLEQAHGGAMAIFSRYCGTILQY